MYNTNTLKLDASIAAILDITNIRLLEKVIITMTATEDWTGTYTFTVFNSPAKNSSQQIAAAVTTNAKELLLTIEPTVQQLDAGDHYYEIFNTLTKRIEFMGDLNIEK